VRLRKRDENLSQRVRHVAGPGMLRCHRASHWGDTRAVIHLGYLSRAVTPPLVPACQSLLLTWVIRSEGRSAGKGTAHCGRKLGDAREKINLVSTHHRFSPSTKFVLSFTLANLRLAILFLFFYFFVESYILNLKS